ncbi:MAG TPA: SdrD B-like domain-containing protein, partial [Bacteroidia bacterium]|nr:SdrD B-like domain-containing protein [Bacteroidia bacterium]
MQFKKRLSFSKLLHPILFIVCILLIVILILPRLALADTLYTDSFTDSDGTPLSTHNAGWSTGSNIDIQNNMAVCVAGPNCTTTWQNNAIIDGCISLDFDYPYTGGFVGFSKVNAHRSLGFFNNGGDNTVHITGYNYDTNQVSYFSSDSYDASSLTGLHTWKECTSGTNATLYLDNTLISSGTLSSDYVFSGNPQLTLSYTNDTVDNFVVEGNIETPTPTPTAEPTATPTPIPTYNITGNVYIDSNQNGTKDGSETNYSGATVSIPGTSYSTTTGSNGNYSFNNVPVGNYYIFLKTPTGYIGTTSGYVYLALSADTTVN